MVDIDKIKNLREKTDLSVMLCRKALEEAGGDESAAMEWLKKHGVEVAKKKSERTTKAGLVESYVHAAGRVGVLVELRCETDFVAKNPAFKNLSHDIAMQIAASSPDDVKELLEQPYIKNLDITVKDYINEAVQKFGENIEVSRFERIEI